MPKTDARDEFYRSRVIIRPLGERLQELERLCMLFNITSIPIAVITDLVSRDYTESDDVMIVLKRHGLLKSAHA